MPYKTVRLFVSEDLSIPGGLWVDIVPFVWLPIGVSKHLTRLQSKLDDTDDPFNTSVISEMLSHLIVDWNLKSDDGSVLAIPVNDLDVIDFLPTAIMNYLIQKAQEDTGEIPLMKETPLLPPSSLTQEPT